MHIIRRKESAGYLQCIMGRWFDEYQYLSHDIEAKGGGVWQCSTYEADGSTLCASCGIGGDGMFALHYEQMITIDSSSFRMAWKE